MQRRILQSCILLAMACSSILLKADVTKKQEYVAHVTEGGGMLSWQLPYPSPREAEFRNQIETRKTTMLAKREAPLNPVLVNQEQLARAKANIEQTDWGKNWFASHMSLADEMLALPDDHITSMISTLTPGWGYGFTCPECVGTKTQIAEGDINVVWNWRRPDEFSCRMCKHMFPSAKYPETAVLQAPRMGQTFTFYRNPQEQAHPDDRSGQHAWEWVNRPLNVSFSGILRYQKNSFMLHAAKSLAYAHLFTGDTRYAEKARDILLRYADAYRGWLYHDVWYTWADCDPLYATFHDKQLPIEWKRSLYTRAYAKDSFESAGMMDTYFCAGRAYPSTDNIGQLHDVALIYDLTLAAKNVEGQPVWSAEQRRKVETDLLLEWLIGGEPFVGGPGEAKETNNKAPRVYIAQAAVGRVLGLPEYMDTALRGTEAIIAKSFTYDGFSDESPAYTNMFMAEMVNIPEVLHDYAWPTNFSRRTGRIDMYGPGTPLRMMYRTYLDQVRQDGRFFPFSDSEMDAHPYPNVMQVGMRRFPEAYVGYYRQLTGGGSPQEYGVFNLTSETLNQTREFIPPEIMFPGWMTALLRHHHTTNPLDVGLVFNGDGGHRHNDMLALFLGGKGINYLTDKGYIGDSPMNAWFKETASHNLVMVDGKNQISTRGANRQPRMEMMFSAPEISVVEASANAYPNVEEYRRLVCLIRGPEGQSLVVDIFRVRGGSEHRWRAFSEVAASDAPGSGSLVVNGLAMPPEPPLPVVGTSQAREDIYGLRDVRDGPNPPDNWNAIWSDGDYKIRLWNLTPANAIRLANAPGQTVRANAGRRLRSLEILRKSAQPLTSTFVVVHEPAGKGQALFVDSIESLDASAGGNKAVALKIVTPWADYLVLNEFAEKAEIEGYTFEGNFGAAIKDKSGTTTLLSCEASTFNRSGQGFSDQPAFWQSAAQPNDDLLVAVTPPPPAWPIVPDGHTVYAQAHDGMHMTGFRVDQIDQANIRSSMFPLPAKINAVRVPALRRSVLQ